MAETERLVKFELLGQEYAFYTAASEEELRAIFNLVRQLVESGSHRTTGTLPVSKIAILACLNIASRYVKLRQEYEAYQNEVKSSLVQLTEVIEKHVEVDGKDR